MDPLQQYAKLRQHLMEEKSQLQSRLAEINQVLGPDSGEVPSANARAQVVATAKPRRGRRTRNTMSMREAVLKALSKGPVARKDLVRAIEAVGYKFASRNPLNSIGSILYAKNSPVKSKDGKFYVEGAGLGGPAESNETEEKPRGRAKKKRKMSAEGRARIAAAAKARWARQKAGK
jgi:hypothetical protein